VPHTLDDLCDPLGLLRINANISLPGKRFSSKLENNPVVNGCSDDGFAHWFLPMIMQVIGKIKGIRNSLIP
jgi:hypothetical protein